MHSVLQVSKGVFRESTAVLRFVLEERFGNLKDLLLANKTPWPDAALAALLALQSPSHPSRLSTVATAGLTPSTLPLLAQFSSITTCCLDCNPHDGTVAWPDEISLAPFEGLPHLTHLELGSAKAQDLDAAQHLTRLSLDEFKLHAQNPALLFSRW